MNVQHHIAIFISGSGSNAKLIMEHFKANSIAKVALLVSNNPDAGGLKFASEYDIPTLVINKQMLVDAEYFMSVLNEYEIDFIALAGFLWLVPAYLVNAFPKRIVNIHPALLPKFGGKGMYGAKVHQAVLDNGEKESGITIHYVDAKFDEGATIFQAKCTVEKIETAETLAKKVQQLEHEWYAKVIEKLLRDLTKK